MPRRNTGPHLVWVEARRSYYVSWTEGGRNHRRAAGRSRGDAQAYLRAFLAAQAGAADAAGGAVDRRDRLNAPHEYPIGDLLYHYAAEKGPAMAAPRALGCAVGHLACWWGDRAVADITPANVEGYRRHRETRGRNRRGEPIGCNPATVDRELTTLKAAVGWARANHRLTDSPPIAVGTGRPGRDRWLERDEALALIAAADAHSPPHVALFVRLGLFLGARHGALLDLTWDRIDIGRRLIILNPTGRRQTAKRRPELRIPELLVPALIRARDRARADGTPWVIAWRGRPIRSVRRGFAAAVARAGLATTGPAAVTPNTLRHTLAAWLVKDGVSLWTVSGQLGHRDPRTTARYAHLAPGHLAEVAEALDRLMA